MVHPDKITLTAVVGQVTKQMKHSTFQGSAGRNVMGNFNVETSGLTDLSISVLIHLLERGAVRVYATFDISIPTGSTDATAELLAPNGMCLALRTPYPTQFGLGSLDPIVGLTYEYNGQKWGVRFAVALEVAGRKK